MPIIRVNLLPPDKRRRERTPFSRFVALVVGTAVNAAIVAFMVKIAFDTHGISQRIDTADNTIKIKQLVEPEYDKVKKEKDKIETRRTAIEALKKERIVTWSKVLDNVWDVVNANQWVWFTGLEAGEGTPKGKLTTPLDLYVILKCNGSASAEDCQKNHVLEVQTKFKNDLWEKFKVVPGTLLKADTNEFHFDWPDESVIVNRKEDPTHRENVYLEYTAAIGRKAAATKSALPAAPPKPK